MRLKKRTDRPKSIGDLLLPIGLLDDGVLLSRDGAMSATWSFRGPDMASETHHHMAVMSSRANQVLRELGDGWMLQVDAIRSASPGYCPPGNFPDTTTRVIDEERRQQFLREGQHYETEYFLTATYLPPLTAANKDEAWLFEGKTRAKRETPKERSKNSHTLCHRSKTGSDRC